MTPRRGYPPCARRVSRRDARGHSRLLSPSDEEGEASRDHLGDVRVGRGTRAAHRCCAPRRSGRTAPSSGRCRAGGAHSRGQRAGGPSTVPPRVAPRSCLIRRTCSRWSAPAGCEWTSRQPFDSAVEQADASGGERIRPSAPAASFRYQGGVVAKAKPAPSKGRHAAPVDEDDAALPHLPTRPSTPE